MNLVVLAGRLGKDPEVKYTQSGQAKANFSVATDSSYRNDAGELIKKADWHNCVAWAKTAENIGKYFHQGDQIIVHGRLGTRSYEAKDGSGKRYITEVTVFAFDFGAKGKGGDSNGHQDSGGGFDDHGSRNHSELPPDDDIPF